MSGKHIASAIVSLSAIIICIEYHQAVDSIDVIHPIIETYQAKP